MKKFPSKISSKNRDKFPDMWYKRVKCYMRRDIFEHILSHEENEYFSLDMFDKKISEKSDMDMIQKIAKELMVELKAHNWNTKLSYGNTALFIYSTDVPPKNCYESEEF